MQTKAETFPVIVLQFLLPDGHICYTSTDLPIEVRQAYLDMQQHGCRLEAEILSTGEVSVTVSNPKDSVDLDIVVTPNGPEVQAGMLMLLKRRAWRIEEKEFCV